MAVWSIEEATLNSIADAVREKTGVAGALSTSEIAEAINGIEVHTNEDLDGMIERTTETVESDTARLVADYAFYNNTAIRVVVLPGIRTIGNYAFCECGNLEHVSFGENSPVVSVGAHAFRGCDELIEVLFGSALTEIGTAAFDGCTSLETVNLKDTAVSTIMPSTFAGSGLRELWLPEARYCSLANVSAFTGAPIGVGGAGGTIYVPSQYRTRYESNSTWVKILGNGKNRIVSY